MDGVTELIRKISFGRSNAISSISSVSRAAIAAEQTCNRSPNPPEISPSERSSDFSDCSDFSERKVPLFITNSPRRGSCGGRKGSSGGTSPDPLDFPPSKLPLPLNGLRSSESDHLTLTSLLGGRGGGTGGGDSNTPSALPPSVSSSTLPGTLLMDAEPSRVLAGLPSSTPPASSVEGSCCRATGIS